jgi:pimeloyl-ACP methyl ester carboxylesterase
MCPDRVRRDDPRMTPEKIHLVRGGGGLRLHVREWGRSDGPPILFLHGLSQSHLCWSRQYDSGLAEEFRLVACDLRGHGMSEAPGDPGHYTDGRLWADDVAAIVDRLGLDRPVLVGWSYGAFVICDYLRAYGPDRIAGINLVAGAVKLGPAAFGTLIGPGFLDHFADAASDDLPTAIRGVRGLVGAFPARPYPGEVAESLLCAAMAVPATSARVRSTPTTCSPRWRCRCWSPRAGPTRWCCRRWPSTSWPSARGPSPPGTTVPGTPRTWRSPTASTASWPASPADVDELLEQELVFEERHVVLVPRVRRDELGGLEQPPPVPQRRHPGLVRRLVAVAGGRGGAAGAVVARPADDLAVQGGGGQIEDENLLAEACHQSPLPLPVSASGRLVTRVTQ